MTIITEEMEVLHGLEAVRCRIRHSLAAIQGDDPYYPEYGLPDLTGQPIDVIVAAVYDYVTSERSDLQDLTLDDVQVINKAVQVNFLYEEAEINETFN